MRKDEDTLIAHIAAGGRVAQPADMTPGYRSEVMRQMVVFVDSALAGAAGLVDHINRAPSLAERITAARIVQEKFEHAHQVLALLEPLGVSPALYVPSHPWDARLDRGLDLGNRRAGEDKRLNVFHYPLEGWLDAVVLHVLMGHASVLQLAEMAASSYAPLAETMAGIVPRERQHAEMSEISLGQALGRDAAASAAAQASVTYWFARVAATFGRTESANFANCQAYGLRQTTNADLLARWRETIAPKLAKAGLTVPA